MKPKTDRPTSRPLPRLEERDLEQVRGGSLNAYFSKVNGEKQGGSTGG